MDAANLEISGREPVTSPAWPVGMIHAVARITSAVEGPLLAAALDTANGAPAHYDVDVGLPDGGSRDSRSTRRPGRSAGAPPPSFPNSLPPTAAGGSAAHESSLDSSPRRRPSGGPAMVALRCLRNPQRDDQSPSGDAASNANVAP